MSEARSSGWSRWARLAMRDPGRRRARLVLRDPGRRARLVLRDRFRPSVTSPATTNGQHADPIDPEPPVGPSVPDDTQVQQSLELAMRLGEVLLSSGEGVADTTAAMLRVADACGMPTCDVDITFTSITMCCHRGTVASPVTTMRIVQYRSLDLTRLTQVTDLVRRVETGAVPVGEATTELSAIVATRHPYPRWLATAAWSAMAASIAVLLGGGAVVAAVAFFSTGLVDRVGRLVNRAGLPLIFQQVVGAALATGVTVGLLFFAVLPPNTRPSLVVAAALTVLLSGLSVVGAVRDAIDGYFLTATARATEVAMFSAGLLAGVVIALKIGSTAGVELAVSGLIPPTGGSVVTRMLAAGCAAGFFALAGYAPLRFLPAAAGTGLTGWAVYSALDLAGFGPVAATGAAAVCVGAAARLLNRWTAVPRLLVTLAGITPLLPGLTAYQGFYQLAVIGVADGLVTVTLALAIGLALAGGVTLGEWLASTLLGDQRRAASAARKAPGQ
ncbi:MAG: threonine/serine ThrE exporter family protein [Pseudonocardia sp.]